MKDWLSISRQDIQTLGGSSLLTIYNGLIPLLQKYFPNHSWTKENKNGSLAQRNLHQFIRNLFPNEDIKLNFHHPELFFSTLKLNET